MTEETPALPAAEAVVTLPEVPSEAPEVPSEAPSAMRPPSEGKSEPSKSVRDSVEKAFREVSERKTGEKKEVSETSGDQPRGPDGKFAPKEAQPATEPVLQPQVAPEAPKAVPELEQAPARFSADAKAEWSKASPALRGEVQRAFREMETGLQEHQQRWAPLKQFDEMAQRSGTTLVDALQNYVGLEQELRRDPMRGLELVCRNMGLDLRQVAEKVMATPPKSEAEIAHERQLEAAQSQLRAIQQQQQQAIEATITHFAQAHPRFEELAEAIGFALQTGKATSLEAAYEYAERLIPSAPAAAPAAPAAPQPPATATPQTGKADLSLHGAPGSAPAKPQSKNVKEAVTSAFARAGLSL